MNNLKQSITIENFSKYLICSNGEIISRTTGKFLKPSTSGNGYQVINLHTDDLNKRKTYNLHVVIAMAFLGYVPNGKSDYVIDHIDNNPKNNASSNLQVITQRENSSKDKNPVSGYHGVKTLTRKGVVTNFSQIKIKGDDVYLISSDAETCSEWYQKAIELEEFYNGNASQFRTLIETNL